MTGIIKQTKDYDLFKGLDCNRKFHEGSLKKLQKSISENNLLEYHPILVNKDYGVLDGQHRLEIARRMKLPIYYQVQEKTELKDMILINNNVKSWGIPDYLNFYSKHGGYENYEKLQKFIDSNNLDVNVALHILSSDRSTGFYKDFKEGKYEFPSEEAYIRAVKKKEMIDETIEYIKKKTSGNKVYLDRVTFYSALVMFFSKENFSYEIFFKKLQYKLDLIRPCSKREEYLKILMDIYNWKNHSPL